jgi:AcrR family transcriptional regulator
MATERSSTKPDGRVKDTRQRIVREALALYYRGGYAGISLDKVAESVEVSKAALFHHFKGGKQELFFTVLQEICSDHQRIVEAAIAEGSDTRSRLLNMLRSMSRCPFMDPMKFLADERDKLSQEQQRNIERAFHRSLRQPVILVLEEGVRRGELRPHNTRLGAAVFLNTIMLLPSPGNPAIRQGQEPDSLQYIDELLDFFLKGVEQN